MIVVVGLSHKTAPIEIRERVAFRPEDLEALLAELVESQAIAEAMIVSTCNRMEIVAAAGEPSEPASTAAIDVIVARLCSAVPNLDGYLYRKQGKEALQHLFRVASSLDSLVLGEPQILGQVKDAFERARTAGTLGAHLHRIVGHAIRTAKRVRSETAVGAGQVSVPSVAVDLARQIFGDLVGRKALLVGSGAMGETAAKLVSNAGAQLTVLGRNQTRVVELADQLDGTPASFDTLERQMMDVDIVISTTSAQQYVIQHDLVQRASKKRRGRSLFLIDLAVPRDIDPKIEAFDGVFLYNVDDLSQVVAQTLSSRQKEAERAEAIVAEETNAYERIIGGEQVKPTILAIRQHLSRVMSGEIERSLRGRLSHLGQEERDALQKMVDASVNKILHPVTRTLRQLASDKDSQLEAEQYATVLCELFELADSERSLQGVVSLPDSRDETGALLAREHKEKKVG